MATCHWQDVLKKVACKNSIDLEPTIGQTQIFKFIIFQATKNYEFEQPPTQHGTTSALEHLLSDRVVWRLRDSFVEIYGSVRSSRDS